MSTKKFKSDVQLEGAIKLPNKTTDRALINNGSGELVESSVTSTELGHLSGTTSSVQTQLDAKIPSSEKGTANGVATLDGGGKVPASQLPNSVMEFKGTFDPATATFTDAGGNAGDVYLASAAGSYDAGSGSITYAIGDWAVHNGTIFEKSLNSNAVVSVFGRTGVVSAQSGDYTASQVTNTPSGNIAATDVQTALNELDTEKQADVITTQGDVIVGDVSGNASRLPIGTNGQVLQSNGTTASWANVSTADEKVKVSANDTTEKYLEDAVVASSGTNTTNPIEISTLNDGADEDLQIQFDETKVVHDNLSGFVANEHIDHSTVNINTNADSGLTGGGDITASRSLSVDINGTTAETSIDSSDELLIYDSSATALRKMTRSNFVAGLATTSAGDIAESSTSFLDNQVTAQNVTGLAFANGTVRSFKAQVTVIRGSTFETFELMGVQKSASWDMSIESVGDDCGVTFSITTAGQVQYTSTSTGSGGTIKFRANTLSV